MNYSELTDRLWRIEQTLQAIMWMLARISNMEAKEMAKIDDVANAVQQESAVDDSAIALLQNLTQMIRDAGTDPAKLDQVLSSIDANRQRLADAVAANTPGAT
jgi:hypothetical protein